MLSQVTLKGVGERNHKVKAETDSHLSAGRKRRQQLVRDLRAKEQANVKHRVSESLTDRQYREEFVTSRQRHCSYETLQRFHVCACLSMCVCECERLLPLTCGCKSLHAMPV